MQFYHLTLVWNYEDTRRYAEKMSSLCFLLFAPKDIQEQKKNPWIKDWINIRFTERFHEYENDENDHNDDDDDDAEVDDGDLSHSFIWICHPSAASERRLRQGYSSKRRKNWSGIK